MDPWDAGCQQISVSALSVSVLTLGSSRPKNVASSSVVSSVFLYTSSACDRYQGGYDMCIGATQLASTMCAANSHPNSSASSVTSTEDGLDFKGPMCCSFRSDLTLLKGTALGCPCLGLVLPCMLPGEQCAQ